MQIRDGVVEAIGNTPLIKLEARLGRDRLHHPRQGRVHEPRRVGEGPRRPPDDPGGGEARRAASPAGSWSRRPPATPASGSRWSPTRAAIAPSSSSRRRRARKRRTCCGSAAPSWSRCRRCPTAIPNNYQHVGAPARRGVAARPRRTACIFADQWNNLDNRKAHYVSTGPEIWDETGGKVDGFICSVGTGGTLAGVSTLPAARRRRTSSSASPIRAAPRCTICSRTARPKRTEGGSITEGIGLGRVTADHRGHRRSTRPISFPTRRPCRSSSICSSTRASASAARRGINVAGAIRLAKELGPGQTIVTVLADYGTRYQSKLFNPEFLRSKNLPVPAWLERKSRTSSRRL